MKTETEVQITLESLEVFQNLEIEPDGFILKFFMSCSSAHTKTFKIINAHTILNQKLHIKNIVGEQLQIWLCTTYNKLIAVTTVSIESQNQQVLQVQLKLNNITFAKLQGQLIVTKRQIQKIVYIQPDEQLLKRQEDPEQVRKRQEEQSRLSRQQAELQKLARQQKKHAITRTFRNEKDQPFI